MRISDWSSDVSLPISPTRNSKAHGASGQKKARAGSIFSFRANSPPAKPSIICTAIAPGRTINEQPRYRDRKSTRLTPVTNAHLVCRLLLEKKTKKQNRNNSKSQQAE